MLKKAELSSHLCFEVRFLYCQLEIAKLLCLIADILQYKISFGFDFWFV